jgi:hypothetical protein
MPVEIFTKAEFEKCLPAKDGQPLWRYAGFDKGEHTYFVQPFPKINYGILVRSSVGRDGTSKGCGEDSIRARIIKIEANTLNYTVHGGLNQQHVKRTKSWQTRTLNMLRKLAGQCQYCLPCPLCGQTLVPFTVKSDKSENKGRSFVKCCSPQCREGDGSKVFIFTEDEAENHIVPNENEAWKAFQKVKKESDPESVDIPQCQKCRIDMRRMNTNNGWRCAVSGNFYQAGKWTKCDYVIWDEGKGPKPREEKKEVPAGLAEVMFAGDKINPGNYETLRKLVEEAWEELSDADDMPATFFGMGKKVKNLRDYLDRNK